MTSTEHLQLNQWAPEDRILRQDFNSDNAKVDAAVAALEGELRPTLIREVVTSAAADVVQLDISDIDWSQWSRVMIDADVRTESDTTPITLTYYVGLTSREMGQVRAAGVNATEGEGTSRLTLLCRKQPQRRIAAVSLGIGVAFYQTTYYRFRELTTLSCTHLTSNGYQISAGSVFRILGVK